MLGPTPAITGSAASSTTSSRSRAPADIGDCADSASASGSGYSDVTSSSRRGCVVEMGTVERGTRPRLEHELTYSDMDAPKGLRNSRGENNCFLNSAVQVSDSNNNNN